MPIRSQVMIHKNSTHWIAKIFIEDRIEPNPSYTLCRSILLYENGDFETISNATSGLKFSELCLQISIAKEKLAAQIWKELEEKGHWITFIYDNPSTKLFDYIANAFKVNLSQTIQRKISNQTTQIGFLECISNAQSKKSIKKALYLSQKKQISQDNRYHPKADFIICRSFDDPNLIVAMINCPNKNMLFKDITEQHAILFLKWLQKYYSTSSIVKSITSNLVYCGNFHTPTWVNIIRMVEAITSTSPYVFSKYFQKVPMNKTRLHDELIRINELSNLKYKTYSYTYTKTQLNLEGKSSHLDFKLPKNTDQLNLWGETLSNCLFSYNELIYCHDSLIIGVYNKEELTYAIEYKQGHILQAYGRFNSEIPQRDLDLIQKWLEPYA